MTLDDVLHSGRRPRLAALCCVCGCSVSVSSTTAGASLERLGWRGIRHVPALVGLHSGYLYVCGECAGAIAACRAERKTPSEQG